MLAKQAEAITFEAFYTASKVGKTGLTVTVDIYNHAGTQIVTGGSATAIGGGFYSYTLASGSNTGAGSYRAVFKTTDTTVDTQHLPALWVSAQPWVQNALQVALDTLVQHNGTAQAGAASSITLASGASSTDQIYKGSTIKIYSGTGAGQARVITAYVGSTKVATIGRAWATNPDSTSLYAVLALSVPVVDDNLAVTAGTLSSTAIQSIWNALTSALTTASSIGKLLVDNLDAAVSSRLATTGYAAPLDSAATATATQTGLTAQGYTSTRAGYLDTLNGLVAAIWAAGTRTLTGFGTLAADVWAAGTRTLTQTVGDATAANQAIINTNVLTRATPADVLTQAQAALTAQGYTTGRAPLLAHLDADVSSRLAATDYTTPPTAGDVRAEIDTNSTRLADLATAISALDIPPADAVAGAVWSDAEVYPADSKGADLASAGAGANPTTIAAAVWNYLTSTSTPTGSILALLKSLAGRVLGAVAVQVVAPTTGSGDVSVAVGDTYAPAVQRLTWVVAYGDGTDFSGAAITLEVLGMPEGVFSGAVLSDTGTVLTVAVDLTEVDSTLFAAMNTWIANVVATLPPSKRRTLVPELKVTVIHRGG